MNIVFRVDASLEIGTGHVMRCLTLANTLKANGAHCHFICRDFSGNFVPQIQSLGFTVNVLPFSKNALISSKTAINKNLRKVKQSAIDWATDATQTKDSLGNKVFDWLIVDHYALDSRWEKALRSQCYHLMVIDDLADRMHDCDLLLDQNLGRDHKDYVQLTPHNCRVLVGPHYALLRPQFSALRSQSLNRRNPPKLDHLLITMGGVDQANATSKVLKELQNCQLPSDLRITVVMGVHAPWINQVQALAKEVSQRTQVVIDVHNIAELMAESDLAISAGGSTSWERCCLGLPSIIVIVADNQRSISNALQQSGSAIVLENVDSIASELRPALELATSHSTFGQLARNAQMLADGLGTNRVARLMGEYHV